MATSSTAIEKAGKSEIIERVIAVGDLSKLSPKERSNYYAKVCESVGLNPFTRPFEYIELNRKLTLYARKDATDQLRKIHAVSIQIISRERLEDVYVVTARATSKDGRTDESIGAVSVKGLSGDALCNALMKSETKAKRRVTLSICGLGWLDESELETIPDALAVEVTEEGEIVRPQLKPATQEPPPTLNPRAKLKAETEQLIDSLAALGHPDFKKGEGRAGRILAHVKRIADERSWDLDTKALESLNELKDKELSAYNGILEGEIEVWKEKLKDDEPF